MGLLVLCALVVLFWAGVHRRRTQLCPQRPLLPTTTVSTPSPLPPPLWTLSRHASVALAGPVVLRAESTALAGPHARLLAALSRRTTPCARAVRAFYDVGVLAALCGQLVAAAFLVSSAARLAARVLPVSSLAPPSTLLRRAALPVVPVAPAAPSSDYVLRPLIPGVTLPLTHLPVVFAAVVFSTALHELGHAIAAAADGIPLLSYGLTLLLVVPAAFVRLAAPATPPPASYRLRVSAAGPLHNLLLFFLLRAPAAFSPAGPVLAAGLAVLAVHEASPLRTHLPPGALITRLDDTSLGRTPTGPPPSALWDTLLVASDAEADSDAGVSSGWCVSVRWFAAHTQTCCAPAALADVAPPAHATCFIPHPRAPPILPHPGHCIDPLPLLQPPPLPALHNHTDRRCRASADCTTDETCVAPHPAAQLLRLYVVDADGGTFPPHERLVLWRGPRREVWAHVTVSPHAAPAYAVPQAISLFLSYTATVSLSLFFLNLLPVRALDGDEILAAVLDLLCGEDADVRPARRAVEAVALLLAGAVLVDGAVA